MDKISNCMMLKSWRSELRMAAEEELQKKREEMRNRWGRLFMDFEGLFRCAGTSFSFFSLSHFQPVSVFAVWNSSVGDLVPWLLALSLETSDLSDIPSHLPTYLTPLENTLKELSQRLVTLETFDQSDDEILPGQKIPMYLFISLREHP